ncbi:type VI secretion protein [Streptomyces sp. Ru73]|nr:type VI secretion protein [Streptomyces sp. Ru73]
MPDSLLVGVLAFLLGLTVLVWLATGLSGLFAHGGWPANLSFTRTPLAMRELATEPHDLATAWPATPKGQLSGYGLFWGVFISELMVLTVLTVFALGTITRLRAVRAERRAERRAGRTTERGAQRPQSAARAPQGGQEQQSSVRMTKEAPAKEAAVEEAAAEDTSAAQMTAGQVPAEQRPTAPPAASVPAPAAPAATTASAAASATVGASAPVEATWTASDGASAATEAAPAATPAPGPQRSTDTRTDVPAEASAVLAGAAAAVEGLTGPAGPALPRVHYHHRAERPAARAAALDVIHGAEGPLLVATTDAALWAETKDARAKLGPVHVYDPQHLLDTPARLRWSPTAGCTDIAVAGSRASALLAPVRPMSSLDSALADAAETLLRCWLHAAAVDGRPFRQIHRWAQGSGAAHEPVRILRTNSKAASGRAGELESVLTAHPERRDMAQQLVARALAALSSVHIRDACNPGRADALALESFVAEGGTLYVVGESIEDPRTAPGAMPLLTALVSSVVEHGRRMAERSSDGRLDPPLTLVLDDIAALAPFPALPGLLETGAAQGLLTLATLRSPEQARARWPHATLPA